MVSSQKKGIGAKKRLKIDRVKGIWYKCFLLNKKFKDNAHGSHCFIKPENL
jgi:hypothetical protein